MQVAFGGCDVARPQGLGPDDQPAPAINRASLSALPQAPVQQAAHAECAGRAQPRHPPAAAGGRAGGGRWVQAPVTCRSRRRLAMPPLLPSRQLLHPRGQSSVAAAAPLAAPVTPPWAPTHSCARLGRRSSHRPGLPPAGRRAQPGAAGGGRRPGGERRRGRGRLPLLARAHCAAGAPDPGAYSGGTAAPAGLPRLLACVLRPGSGGRRRRHSLPVGLLPPCCACSPTRWLGRSSMERERDAAHLLFDLAWPTCPPNPCSACCPRAWRSPARLRLWATSRTSTCAASCCPTSTRSRRWAPGGPAPPPQLPLGALTAGTPPCPRRLLLVASAAFPSPNARLSLPDPNPSAAGHPGQEPAPEDGGEQGGLGLGAWRAHGPAAAGGRAGAWRCSARVWAQSLPLFPS